MFHQDDTWQNNQAVKHQWRLGRIINVSFSLFQCVLLLNLDITKSAKLAICFFISKLSYFEIFFMQISTVADGFFLHGRGGIIFRIIGQLGKAKLNEKKKIFNFVYRRRKIRFHALSTISSNWWYDVKPAMLSHPLCPTR